MSFLRVFLGVVFILIVLGDAFETIVLPRRVTRQASLARLFYKYTWQGWLKLIRLIFPAKRHEGYLSFYGPLSLVVLLIFWATCLIVGFGLILWGTGSLLKPQGEAVGLSACLYLSGETFFTLGLGDVLPQTSFGRGLVAFEAGMGFGFLALVIGYLPVLNQSFARREVNISMLDARAGSPPTAGEMFRRHCHDHGLEDLQQLFHEWERWSADLLESHLSYPVLGFFRSHHENQSWLGALTAILDATAFAIVSLEGGCERQAQLTFAITRHTIVDLAHVFSCPPHKSRHDRLPPADLARMRDIMREAGLELKEDEAADQKLLELRQMYEPYVHSLSKYLHIAIQDWLPKPGRIDNWQTSAWGRSTGFQIEEPPKGEDEHF